MTNPTLYFKVEEWSRLSESVQIKLCATRKVILTDYDDRTTGEKAREIIRKFNLTNFNKAIDKTTKGIDEFSKMMDSLHVEMDKKDLSALTGGKKKNVL